MTVDTGGLDVGQHLEAMTEQEEQRIWILERPEVAAFKKAVDVAIRTHNADAAFKKYASEREQFIKDLAAQKIAEGVYADDEGGKKEATRSAAEHYAQFCADEIVPRSPIVDASMENEVLHTYSKMMSALAMSGSVSPAGCQVLANLEARIDGSNILESPIRMLVSAHVAEVHKVSPFLQAEVIQEVA